MHIKTKFLAALSIFTTTKRLWNVSRHDMRSGSHNIGLVCLGCISYLSFLFFSLTIIKTDFLQGAIFDVSNLYFLGIFSMQVSNAWQSRLSWSLYFWALCNLDPFYVFWLLWFSSHLLWYAYDVGHKILIFHSHIG